MGLLDSERLAFLKKLRPSSRAGAWASLRLEDVVGAGGEAGADAHQDAPDALPVGRRRGSSGSTSIESAKGLASLSGSVSGVFGLVSVPADLVVMAWLQIRMLADIATAYGVDLRFRRARTELLGVLGEANGVGPLQRSGPKVLGRVAAVLAERGGFVSLGRAMPLVAAPVTAWLNNHHIQMVGEAALAAVRRLRARRGEDAGGLGGDRAMSATRRRARSRDRACTPRRAFERELAFAVQVARRAAQPCSLLVVDVDDFQALRDVRGDLAADTCIEALAQRISAESNGAGPIGRLGGGHLRPAPSGLGAAPGLRAGRSAPRCDPGRPGA